MPDVKVEPGSNASDNGGLPTSGPLGGRAGDADPLGSLYKMSTTAGVGSQDYVAINGTSLAALVLGVASILVVLVNVLLVIPLAGIVCAILAIRQIRSSNGTQTGIGFAVIGLLLALLFGGGRLGWLVVSDTRARTEERQVSERIKQFGKDLAAGNYDAAYAQTDERFQNRVDKTTFQNAFKGVQDIPELGGITGADWNGERMYIESQPDTDTKFADAMAFFRFARNAQPGRYGIHFQTVNGEWKIDDIPQLFPAKKKKKDAPQ